VAHQQPRLLQRCCQPHLLGLVRQALKALRLLQAGSSLGWHLQQLHVGSGFTKTSSLEAVAAMQRLTW
jgi:hypothetical protein